MKLLDTSVILRFLTKDDPRKAERAKKLILESNESMLISDIVFMEVVYALERLYGLPRHEIYEMLSRFLSSKRIDFFDRELLLQAIVLYKEHNVPFVDAYQVTIARKIDAEAILTFDSHFEKRLKFAAEEP